MVALSGFPMVSQLTTVTGDGQPSENAQQDCVAASIDAACRYLLNQPENSVFNPDHFKDIAAGQGYRGGTSASEYVAFCKSLGVQLWAFKGMPAILINEAHKQLDAGHPVIFTEPDPYVSASLGWTHVCVFYAEGPGYLVALDPYIARPIRRTDQEWATLLLNGEIWIAQLEEEMIQPLDIAMPAVAALFRQLDTNHWQSLKTGCILQYGFLANYKANGQASLDYLGDVVQNEVQLGSGKVMQRYERGVRLDDNNNYSSLPLYDGPGVDPLVGKLEAQITAMQSRPDAPQATALITEIVDAAAQLGIKAK